LGAVSDAQWSQLSFSRLKVGNRRIRQPPSPCPFLFPDGNAVLTSPYRSTVAVRPGVNCSFPENGTMFSPPPPFFVSPKLPPLLPQLEAAPWSCFFSRSRVVSNPSTCFPPREGRLDVFGPRVTEDHGAALLSLFLSFFVTL